MRRLHLQLYLAIIGTLAAFLICGAVVWHYFAAPRGAVWGVESAAELAAEMLDDQSVTPARRKEIVVALARQLHADVALYGANGGEPLATHGDSISIEGPQLHERSWRMTHGGPIFNLPLRDGHLLVHPRMRYLLHGLHMGLILVLIAVTLALLTYPITRSITARLGRLKIGVQQFGGGNLAARVKVEGRDEVAALATSFNESAARVEELMRAHKLLLANCPHELRTPLARLRMGIERVPGTDAAVIAALARNIEELDALIGEMLLSSRLDVSSGLDRAEAVDLLALAAEEASHFDCEVSGEALTLVGDPLLLRRLVRNLLDNARLHGGGATDVRIERAGDEARLIVEDAGDGIATLDREKIFEPFYRTAAGTRAIGAGLGLAIVKQIARAHGGSVEYQSREAGGSRFVVRLPLHPPA